MIQNYYPIDFEAQYEDTSEKMIEISNKYKDIILNNKPISIDQIETDLESLQVEVEENDLLFRKQSVYSQFASGQLMAERRKQPPEMCPECGDELKKYAQCEFCAELYCKKCCSRNRVIPFVSKQQKLCCEQCHFKFIKLFDNKDFYEEKEKLINVLNFTRNKTNKVFEKIENKKKDLDVVKEARKMERIKERNVQKKIQEEEKKVKQLQEQFKKVIAEKAQRIQKEQKNKAEKAERDRQEKIKQQQLRKEEQQRQQRQRQIEAMRQQEQQKLQKEKEQKDRKQKERKNTQNDVKKKQEQEKQKEKEKQMKAKYEQEMKRKQEEIEQLRRQLQKSNENSNEKKEKQPSQSSKSSKKQSQTIQTPKHQSQKLMNTAQTTSNSKKDRSRKGSSQISHPEQNLKNSRGRVRPSLDVNATPVKSNIEQQKKNSDNNQYQDGLQKSLAKVFKLGKEDESKSIISNMSKTSKNVIDMSVNELLGLRIPIARSNSKIDENERNQAPQSSQSLPIEEENAPVSPLSSRVSVDRASVKIESIEPQISKEDLQRERNQAIKNSTMISSTNKEGTQTDGISLENKKCQCSIM